MPGGRRGNGKRLSCKRGQNKSLGDVTLNDFANSLVPSGAGRLKKAITNTVIQQANQLCNDQDERSWFEKSEDEFIVPGIDTEIEDEDLEKPALPRKPRRRRQTTGNSNTLTDDYVGAEYPIDIWFLISEYINPEDVGRFAAICKSTLCVTTSPKFWFGMYKRFYRSVPSLPERLQPEMMIRLYGLRANVIRCMFFTYPQFTKKLKSVTTFEGNPHDLVKRQCILIWHQKQRNQWQFFFKLREIGIRVRCLRSTLSGPDLLTMLDDVDANPEMGCKVLQVTCQNFVSILPSALGQVLGNVSLTLSQGMHYHRLRLAFGPAHMARSGDLSSCTVVVLDPVINIRVMDWWHPHYPYLSEKAAHYSDSV